MKNAHDIVRALLVVSGLSLVLASCSMTRPLRTSSGLPEILMKGTSRPRVSRNLTQQMEDNGFETALANDHVAVFERPSNGADTLFYGGGFNLAGTYRVTCTLHERPDSIYVVAEIQIVTDEGMPSESVREAPQGADVAHEVQDVLDLVNAGVALERHRLWIEELDERGHADAPVWTGATEATAAE